MKRFAVSVLSISVFFVGLGSLAEQVGARFKSDEKALDIVRKARTALGGDAALVEVRSMVITGRSLHTMKIGDQERQEPGETEIALQFPDKMSQKIKIGNDDGTHAKMMSEHHEMIVMNHGGDHRVQVVGGESTGPETKTIVIEGQPDGNATFRTDDGKKVIVREIEKGDAEAGALAMKMREPGKPGVERDVVFARAGHGGMRQNDLLKLSLSLLLTAPEGIEVNYTFAGEGDIDGTPVNIVNAAYGESNYKLFIGKSNNLPVAISYRGMPMPRMVKFIRDEAPAGDAARDHAVFTKKLHDEMGDVEHIVKFSDYRSTGSVQLPYKWTTTVGGAVKETFDVTSYDINPVNIAEKFADQKVFIRTKKADGQ